MNSAISASPQFEATEIERKREIYREMVRLRVFDRKAIRLQRTGRIGTYPPIEGQEACQIAPVHALLPSDIVVPTYRDYGAMMAHGIPMENILMYWNGRMEGCQIPPDVSVFPMAIPIATQLPHAVGAAWASRQLGKNQVVLVYFGDGATSEGDFHEALNFASVFQLPVVFFCQNNQYAISVPIAKQTATETLAEKAAAYAMPGVRVAGHDVGEIYRAVETAAERARSGLGPTLIEALTYRFGPHTTSDDPTKYRSTLEEMEWRERDPIQLLHSELALSGWTDEDDAGAIAQAEEAVTHAVSKMESLPRPNLDDLFDHVYASLPNRLIDQRDELRRFANL